MSDEYLVRAARKTAFEMALVATRPQLRTFAGRLTKNSDSAQDLVQDAMEHALIKSEELENIDSILGWTKKILFRKFLSRRRLHSVKNEIPASAIPAYDANTFDIDNALTDIDDPELIMIANETVLDLMEKQKNHQLQTDNRSKAWIIESPEGTIFEIFNLAQFCRGKNLKTLGFSRVLNGTRETYKGYKIRHKEKDK